MVLVRIRDLVLSLTNANPKILKHLCQACTNQEVRIELIQQKYYCQSLKKPIEVVYFRFLGCFGFYRSKSKASLSTQNLLSFSIYFIMQII